MSRRDIIRRGFGSAPLQSPLHALPFSFRSYEGRGRRYTETETAAEGGPRYAVLSPRGRLCRSPKQLSLRLMAAPSMHVSVLPPAPAALLPAPDPQLRRQ